MLKFFTKFQTRCAYKRYAYQKTKHVSASLLQLRNRVWMFGVCFV